MDEQTRERVRVGGSSEENGLTTNPKRCVLFDFCGGSSSPLQLSHSPAAFFQFKKKNQLGARVPKKNHISWPTRAWSNLLLSFNSSLIFAVNNFLFSG